MGHSWCVCHCVGVQFLQTLIGGICIMFGILWFRAVERVRASVIERMTVARHVNEALTGLCVEMKVTTVSRLVAFQAAVRRRQAIRLRRRLEAMEAYVMGLWPVCLGPCAVFSSVVPQWGWR